MPESKAKKIAERLLPDELEVEYPPPKLRAKWRRPLTDELTPAQKIMEKMR